MGILKNIKNLLNSSTIEEQKKPEFDEQLNRIINEVYNKYGNSWWYDVALGKIDAYQELKSKDVVVRKQYVNYLIDEINRLRKINHRNRNNSSVINDKYRYIELAYSDIMSNLLRSNLNYTTEELIYLFEEYRSSDASIFKTFISWPIGFSVQQIEKTIKSNGLDSKLKKFIEDFLSWPEMKQQKSYGGADLEKIRVKLEKLLFESDNKEGKTAPYTLPNDRLGIIVNKEIRTFKGEQQDLLYQLFYLFIKASSSKPSQKFLKNTSSIIDRIGINKYKTIVHPWLEFVCSLKEIETTHTETWENQEYTYTSYEFIHEKNSIFLKGMIWSMAKFHDSKTLNIIGKLTERCFKKIPGVGPTAAGVGNACIYVLGNTKGLEGVSHLSRLKLKVTQNNTRKLIEKYLEEASEKLGISSSEIEEISIPDFDLIDGIKTYHFDDYLLRLEIKELGKVILQWTKPDGKLQKTIPTFVKNSSKLSEKLKKAKDDVKQVKKYLTAQRDRIDRLYINNRIWNYEDFQKNYLNHGLVNFITKKLLWQFKKQDKFITAIYKEGNWFDKEDIKLDWIETSTLVRLWHPIYSTIDNVLYWRNRFEELAIKQPLKQVYREVYILTDAEINTKIYSNRMAAHILKQHQFNALTGVRGWKYSLMGAYDDGVNSQMASINIKPHNISAEFWINEIGSDDEFNDAGIWNYIATDQVRFIRQDGEVVDLAEIPKLVLSEVMRDVDLFVGVCSVGNDPEWRDNGGLPQYRDYWAGYSFGSLTEVAKTRKVILEKLLPRLKINKISTIDGKFLKVKGTKRTYKIHIGSTNILMEPNDQYLCIVPARGKDKQTENIFLPFEGDRGLSVILSKAFLLAADDKITDSTILSQIG